MIKNEIFLTVLVFFFFSIFINKVLFESHSLGENLNYILKNFQTQLVLQPHRVLLPLMGKLVNLDIQIWKSSFLYLVYLCTHNVFNQNKHTQKNILFCNALSTTMILQFHLNFGATQTFSLIYFY